MAPGRLKGVEGFGLTQRDWGEWRAGAGDWLYQPARELEKGKGGRREREGDRERRENEGLEGGMKQGKGGGREAGMDEGWRQRGGGDEAAGGAGRCRRAASPAHSEEAQQSLRRPTGSARCRPVLGPVLPGPVRRCPAGQDASSAAEVRSEFVRACHPWMLVSVSDAGRSGCPCIGTPMGAACVHAWLLRFLSRSRPSYQPASVWPGCG